MRIESPPRTRDPLQWHHCSQIASATTLGHFAESHENFPSLVSLFCLRHDMKFALVPNQLPACQTAFPLDGNPNVMESVCYQISAIESAKIQGTPGN
jgi:hypothetical protein